MIIEREKMPDPTLFQSIQPGEVFCAESGSRNRVVDYYIKLSDNTYDEYGADYDGETYNAVDLATGRPVFFHSSEKCIVKPTAKLIFVEN